MELKPEYLFRTLLIILVLYVILVVTFLQIHERKDGMNYITVARNISAGKGIVQNSLGYNVTNYDIDDSIPTPLTVQPPLYPIAIAGIATLGISHVDAAAILSSLGVMLTIIGIYCLYRLLYDFQVAVIAALIAFAHYPLLYAGLFPLTDTLGVAVTVWWLWALVHTSKQLTFSRWSFLAGILAGISFGIRYIFGLWLPIGLILLSSVFKLRRIYRGYLYYLVGWGIIAFPIVLRNRFITGTFMGGSRNPSNITAYDNLKITFEALLGQYNAFESFFSSKSFVAISIIGLFLSVIFFKRYIPQSRKTQILIFVRNFFLDNCRWWPLFSASIYIVVLVVYRSVYHFDTINFRLVLFTSLILFVTVCLSIFRILSFVNKKYYVMFMYFWFAIILLQLLNLVLLPRDDRSYVENTPLLQWIQNHTTPERTLIIGEDSVFIPFYLPKYHTLSFSPYPYTDYLDHTFLTDWVCEHQDKYSSAYLYTTKFDSKTQLENLYGSFIANIYQENIQDYPNISLVTVLSDGRKIFRVDCLEGNIFEAR